MHSILALFERVWHYGGGELATNLILQLLKNEGFDITVVTGMKEEIGRVQGINYVYSSLLDTQSKILLWKNLVKLPNWLKRLISQSEIVYVPRVAYPVIPYAKKLGKKVIVHLHNYQPITYTSIIYHGEKKGSVMSEFKKSFVFEIEENKSLLRGILSCFISQINKLCLHWLKHCNAIICVSKRQAEIVSEWVPELANKIRVIYNPLPEVTFIAKSLKKPIFLYIGGESYNKGFYVLLRAINKALLKKDLTFIFAGSFSNGIRTELRRKHPNVIRLTGHLPHTELLRLHGECRASLFPSICEEPLPYAVIESMLAGTIPIASEVGGIPEIVEGTFAERFMFKPGDVDGLIDRMEAVLAMSSSDVMNIGLKLREAVLRRFSIEDTKKRLLEVFST
ncbi:MAG: glycosyltransferase family 4 protein [Candidatus Nezhaarchaeales archaeon]